MSWDIYGNRLERGHCEVHPWVHEEYPCPTCLSEAREKKRLEEEEARYWAAMAEQEYAAYERGWYESIGFDPVAMGM